MNTQLQEGQVTAIKISDISPSPFQPRKHFDPAALDELASSIKEKGVLQPITVRPTEGGATPFELVMGERRWRASQKAGLETVSALVRILTDEQAREIALVENLQRADLTPMEEARSIQDLVETKGGNKSEAARVLGKAEPYVYNKLALLTLPRDVQNMLDVGAIKEAAARVVLEIDGEDKQVQAAKLAEKLNLSATELRARMQKHIGSKGNDNQGSSTKGSGERKATSFKHLSAALVSFYEAVEGFDFNELEGDEKGLKARETLRRQFNLLRPSIARAETALLRDPPAVKKTDVKKPPRLTAA
jgi:ParB family chromosome partitioning protein